MSPPAWFGFVPGLYRADRSAPLGAFGVSGFTMSRRLAAILIRKIIDPSPLQTEAHRLLQQEL
jgi:hypothetical protein